VVENIHANRRMSPLGLKPAPKPELDGVLRWAPKGGTYRCNGYKDAVHSSGADWPETRA